MVDAGFGAGRVRGGFTQRELDAMVQSQKTREDAQHDTHTPTEHPEGSPAPDRAATGRAGHWMGTEEAQANYLIAAMTGRTPEEVKEPLSRLLHELRYDRTPEEEEAAMRDDAKFEAERVAVQQSYIRLQRMERREGDARRMLREAFETAGTALGDTEAGRRMFRHVFHVKNLP